MLAIEIALRSETGGRAYNEDACGHWHDDRHLVCVLADGAGGHGGGDVAARTVVRELIGRFSSSPSVDGAALGGLLRETNLALISQRVRGTPSQDMHSTAVCLVLDYLDHRAHWGHAGDSRLYWFRKGRLLKRTRDHSLVQTLVDTGLLAEAELQSHPRRNELRSALGIAPEQFEVSSADSHVAVEPGDVFLLCTDGLWEYIGDPVIEAALVAAQTPREWLDALAAEVFEAAAHKTSHDNFTALAIWTGEA